MKYNSYLLKTLSQTSAICWFLLDILKLIQRKESARDVLIIYLMRVFNIYLYVLVSLSIFEQRGITLFIFYRDYLFYPYKIASPFYLLYYMYSYTLVIKWTSPLIHFYAFEPYINSKYVISTYQHFVYIVVIHSVWRACASFYQSNQFKVNVLMQLMMKRSV